jgi:hypothetical protein
MHLLTHLDPGINMSTLYCLAKYLRLACKIVPPSQIVCLISFAFSDEDHLRSSLFMWGIISFFLKVPRNLSFFHRRLVMPDCISENRYISNSFFIVISYCDQINEIFGKLVKVSNPACSFVKSNRQSINWLTIYQNQPDRPWNLHQITSYKIEWLMKDY